MFNEGGRITAFPDRLFETVTLPCEVLAVYDRTTDSTVEPLSAYAKDESCLRPLLNMYGTGPWLLSASASTMRRVTSWS